LLRGTDSRRLKKSGIELHRQVQRGIGLRSLGQTLILKKNRLKKKLVLQTKGRSLLGIILRSLPIYRNLIPKIKLLRISMIRSNRS
jgi:hypothetical protein